MTNLKVMQQRFEDLAEHCFAVLLENGTEPALALERGQAVAGHLIHYFTDEAMEARGLVLEKRSGRRDSKALH